MKKKCNICGKAVEAQGLGGHLWGVHGVRVGTKYEIEELKKRIQELKKRIGELEEYVGRRINNLKQEIYYIEDTQFLLKILAFLQDITDIKVKKPTQEIIEKWKIPIGLK